MGLSERGVVLASTVGSNPREGEIKEVRIQGSFYPFNQNVTLVFSELGYII